MSEDTPNVTFSGGLMMSDNGEDDNTGHLEIESDYIGTVEPKIGWVKDCDDDDEVAYWPQLVLNTEFGSYSISLVDRDHNLEAFAEWMLDELEKGPDSRV